MIGWIIFFIYIFIVNGCYSIKLINRKTAAILTCFGMVFFQGIRSIDVGIDLRAYYYAFQQCGKLGFSELYGFSKSFAMEPLYIYFCKICTILTNSNWQLYLIIVSLICCIPICLLAYKYTDNSFYTIIVYLTLGNYMFTFSAIRQSIAISLCIIAFINLLKGRRILFIVIVLIASRFHASALVFLIVIFGTIFKYNNKSFMFFIMLALIIMIFTKYLIKIIVSMLLPEYLSYISSDDSIGMFTIYLFITFIILNLIGENNDKNNGLIMFMIACAMLCQSFGNVSPITGRITLYFIPYIGVRLSNTYSVKIKTKEIEIDNIISKIYILTTFIFLIYHLNTAYLDVVPYTTIWG